MNIEKELFALQDLKYKDFIAKLTPSVDKSYFIGIRTPIFRSFAKRVIKDNNYDNFLKKLPHKYYEEDNLHGVLISEIKDYDVCLKEVNRFLPYVNNWATCDTLVPKCFEKNLDKLYKEAIKWCKSKETYTIRFGVNMLMKFYLKEYFKPEYLEVVKNIKSDEYYVNMIRAWFFQEALTKQEKATLPYFKKKLLDPWTHKKAISKCIDSFRISDEMKDYLKTLR